MERDDQEHRAGTRTPPSRIRKAAFLVLWLVFCVLLLWGGGELWIRLGIRFGAENLRNPANYTHAFCDEDYHKLRFFWSRTKDLHPGSYVQDPELGWIPDPATSPAPVPSPRSPSSVRVALFGDSFAAGVPPARPDERIAPLLSDFLPSGEVLDYSVAGYGVDQIYLRFRQVAAETAPDVAVVGILLDDIDRVVERFRAGPKPYFVLEDRKLVLRGVPVDKTPEEWIRAHPVKFRSFLLALLKRRYSEWREGVSAFDSSCRRDEKETIARKILENMNQESEVAGIRLLIVLFYGESSLYRENWRESFLKSTLDDLHIAYVDTKPLLLELGRHSPDGTSAFFFPLPNGHLNAQGNTAVATAVYRALAPGYGWGEDIRQRWKVAVDLGAGQDGTDSLKSGWEQPKHDFVWTTSPEALIQVPAPDPPEDLLLYLELLCVVRRDEDDRSLTVAVDGTVVHVEPLARFPACWVPHTLRVDVPRELITGDNVSVSLELPYLLTPQEGGFDIQDERPLGVAVKSLTLRLAGQR